MILDKCELAELKDLYDPETEYRGVREMAKYFGISEKAIAWALDYKDFRAKQTKRARIWQKNNPEKVKIAQEKYAKKYRQTHKQEQYEYSKSYIREHREEHNRRQRNYYQKHKKEIKECRKRYYQEHKEEYSERQKKYYRKHKKVAINNN